MRVACPSSRFSPVRVTRQARVLMGMARQAMQGVNLAQARVRLPLSRQLRLAPVPAEIVRMARLPRLWGRVSVQVPLGEGLEAQSDQARHQGVDTA